MLAHAVALLLVATSICGLGWIGMIVVWRIFLHPLSRYPGPWLAAITNGYMAYHSWKGDIHLDMYRMHEKYGDIVRCGPNRILVNSPTAVKVLYTSGSAVQKSGIYKIMAHGPLNILTLQDKKLHASRRRVLSQAFSEAALRTYEDVIQKQIEKFCTQIQQTAQRDSGEGLVIAEPAWTEPMDMASWCNYLFFDIMTSVIFGKDYNLVGNEQHRPLPEAIEQSNVRMSVLLSDNTWSFAGLDKKLFPQSIEGRNSFLKFVGKLLQDRGRQASDVKRDVFSILLETKDPETGEKLSSKQIAAESVTLIVAGADTSSTAFAGWLFYISHHSEAYAKVAQEVRHIFGTAASASSGPKLGACTYLRASIQESMRMTPPVGGPMWREVAEPQVSIDGFTFPQGCEIGVSAYSIQHNDQIFDQPYEYRPERWISGKDEDVAPQAWTSFIPFSAGSRGCIGRSLAMREMMLTAATLLLRFDFKIADGDIGQVGQGGPGLGFGRGRADEYQLYEHVTSAKQGPYLQFRVRDAPK